MTIDVKVPEGESGDWSVREFTVTEDDVKIFNLRETIRSTGRYLPPGTYKRLMYKGSVVMSNTPAEIGDCIEFIDAAKGNVLINGLGLGVVLSAVLEKDEVESVTVIEISEDVIRLVAPTFEEDLRVTIIHADAFEWKPPKGVRYNAVWHDIWSDICTDNLKEMEKLHRKYGKRCDWQDSWCKQLCIFYRRKGY